MSKIRTRISSTVAAFGVLPAAAVLTITAPGAAHASDWFGQGQYGNQSNSTQQNSSARSGAGQYAPAGNDARGLWGAGSQVIGQANGNGSRATSGNSNVTGQRQTQNQVGAPAYLLGGGQGQGGDQSNSTKQDSSAESRAVQVAPATNVNVGGGDQSIYQANRNGSRATSGNRNATGQNQTQNQGAAAAPLRLSGPVHHAHTLPLPVGQGQRGDQSNSTEQNSTARSEARQYAPAYNVGGRAQRIVQGNGNAGDAASGNANLTGQDQTQNQGLTGLR